VAYPALVKINDAMLDDNDARRVARYSRPGSGIINIRNRTGKINALEFFTPKMNIIIEKDTIINEIDWIKRDLKRLAQI
jgi:hypothetical protein